MRVLAVFFQLCAMALSPKIAAQNLVPDPGFENNRRLPVRKENSIMCTRDWISPTVSVSDYYHRKSGWHAGVPRNVFGRQKPRSGNAYAGICVRKKFKEYLETKLIDTLKKDQSYLIEFYWCRAERSIGKVKELGVMFSGKVRWGLDIHGIKEKPSVEIINADGFSNKRKWNKFSAVYQAQGNETHLILGHFNYDGNKPFKGIAHYYIEDVSVTLIENKPQMIKENVMDKITATSFSPKIGESFVLNNLFFSSNDSEILEESFEALDSLVAYLSIENNTNIFIAGHTDNSGQESKNKTLSQARAKAVADYLVSKGIELSRIQFAGHGSSLPITGNETETDKAKNRRVEVTLEKH